MESKKPEELAWMDVQVGDVLAVHSGTSLLSRGISTHMRLWLRANGYSVEGFPHIIHHIARVVDVWGHMHIGEAVREGVVVKPMLEQYSVQEYKERVIVLRRNCGYSDDHLKAMSREMQRLAMIGSPYEYGNFYRHIIYYLNSKKRWIGGGKSDEAYYCSELAATIENFVYPGSFRYPERTNPMEVYLFSGYNLVQQRF